MWEIRRLGSPALPQLSVCLPIDRSPSAPSPFVINQASAAPCFLLPSPGETLTRLREKWQWWNGPGGMMLLSSANGTIVPEHVNCYPGSTVGSQWMVSQALSSGRDRGSLCWYTRAYWTNIWLLSWDDKSKCLGFYACNRRLCRLIAVKAPFKEVFQPLRERLSVYISSDLWKAVKIAHMVFISQGEKNTTTSQEVPFLKKNPPQNWITFTGFSRWQIALHHSTERSVRPHRPSI